MKHVKLFEQFVNEADMTKRYDGFIILDVEDQTFYKAKYIKGTKSVTAENDAIARLMKKIGKPRSNFMVHGSVAKGEWDKSDLETV